jgi:hypothetical protein
MQTTDISRPKNDACIKIKFAITDPINQIQRIEI